MKKLVPIIYSVTVDTDDGLRYGSVEATWRDGSFCDEFAEVIIHSRQGDKIHISDITAVRGLHCALGKIISVNQDISLGLPVEGVSKV